MAGEEGVLELREDGVLVAEHLEQRLAGGDAGDGVGRISSLTGRDSQPDAGAGRSLRTCCHGPEPTATAAPGTVGSPLAHRHSAVFVRSVDMRQ